MVNNYFKKFSNEGIPFMDNAKKGDITDLQGEILHISDWGYITKRNGKFAVITFKEHPGYFYFGGLVLTNMLETIDEDGEQVLMKSQGIVLETKTTKDGERSFMTVDFVE